MKKFYYVPWEGYQSGSEPPHRETLDRLCLQGPHTLEKAQELAQEMRKQGLLASVIDCSESLKYAHVAPEMLQALHTLSTLLYKAYGCAFPPSVEKEMIKITAIINKAEGKV